MVRTAFLLLLLAAGTLKAQVSDSTADDPLSLRPIQVGFDVLYGWRSNSESGLGLMASYRTPIGPVDLEGNLFQRFFSGADTAKFSFGRFGFGFGLSILIPRLFTVGKENRITIEPKVGTNFTVWATTLGIGFPTGAEVHIPIVTILDASFGFIVEPQFNLNAEKNTVVYDLRVGVRFH